LEGPLVGAQAALYFSNLFLKNEGTIHFVFGGQFYVSQTGSKDGLRSTSADFFIK
jgi:hypothetical protein